MQLDNSNLKQIQRRSLDIWIQKLPFQIIFSGLGVIGFLGGGYPSRRLTIGILTAALAILAMYGPRIWPLESNKAKSFWCFGINFIFGVPAFLIAPRLGKLALVLAAVGAVLIPLTFLLEWIYRHLFARRG